MCKVQKKLSGTLYFGLEKMTQFNLLHLSKIAYDDLDWPLCFVIK